VVAGAQAERVEQLREALGTFVQLPVGDDLAGGGHDVGRVLTTLLDVGAGVEELL
jgi:hypothetical protein